LSDAAKGNLWIDMSHALICQGRFRDALVAVDNGVALALGNSLLLINRGEVYSHLGREAEALACYEEAHAAQPDALLPQIDIAAALVTLGLLDEAKAQLDAVLAVDGEHGCAWYVTGMRETALDHFDDALDAFDKSIILEPGHASHYAAFAELLLKLEDPVHAGQVIERALAIDAFDARTWRIKAQALRAAGKLEEADEAERHGAALLAEQTAQVDAYLQAKGQHGGLEG
jgi:tetratricopeptide (TPR) repeat protein